MDAPLPPLVSIVTPSYQSITFLEEAMRSVFTQDYPRIEYIVADGGSTDGTLELLERHCDRLRYFSGKDEGPADAIDKGLRIASGDIFGWINADDTLLPGAVRAATEYLTAHPDVDVVYGEGNWIDEKGQWISRYPTLPFDAHVLERDCFICQPAAFIRASAYRRCPLDPLVKLSFDYDLWIRMAKQGLKFAAIPNYMACTRMHPEALTLKAREAVLQASMELLRRHYGYVPLPWVFGYAMYREDAHDQFFQPLRPTLSGYLKSLPLGFRFNPARRLRFLAEWLGTPVKAGFRRLAGRAA
jgi:glycosyltransferase involved in cell wall biosynthesis